MSALLLTLTDPAVLTSAADPQVLAAGIMTTASDQLTQFQQLLLKAAGVAGIIFVAKIAYDKGMGMAAVLTAILVVGVFLWAVNGGADWFQKQVSGQVNTTASIVLVTPEPPASLV